MKSFRNWIASKNPALLENSDEPLDYGTPTKNMRVISMTLIGFKEWRKDKETFKGQRENPQGYIAGNPRFGKNQNKLGNSQKTRSKIKDQDRKNNYDQEQEET